VCGKGTQKWTSFHGHFSLKKAQRLKGEGEGEGEGRKDSPLRQKFQSPMMCCMVIHDLWNYGTPWAKWPKFNNNFHHDEMDVCVTERLLRMSQRGLGKPS
jgi:hypothetical protein